MDRSEYAKIKISDIPSEFIEEYSLQTFAHNGWVYLEIVRGWYGLTQSGKLAKYLLHIRLKKSGYFEAATTPGIRRHTWYPIQFFLIFYDFGIGYVGENHTQNLRQVLQEYYEISEDWKEFVFSGIELEWNYAAKHNDRTCRLKIKGYIERVLLRFDHKIPNKPQISPYKHREIHYGAKVQVAPEEVDSPSVDAKGIKRVQAIVGALIFCGKSVDNKVLVSLNTIGNQQAAATEITNEAIDHLLNYLYTYPNNGIVYRDRKMVLAVHSDSSFRNESKGWSQAGAHVFMAEDEPIPIWNGPILTISQVIKFFMSSAAEAEIGAIFIK